MVQADMGQGLGQGQWGAPREYGAQAVTGGPYQTDFQDDYNAMQGEAASGSQWQEAPARQGGGILNVIGAGVSVLLIAGLAFWGYRLAVRDVTGVPVVRALEGPMRIQPDNPGGQAAAYQGFAVNAVQADGTTEPPADTLALAPDNTGLAPEDTPSAEVAAVSAAPAPAGDPAGDPEAAMQALADQIAAGAEPLSDVTATLATTEAVNAAVRAASDVAADAAAIRVIPASVPGVSRSPRPVLRPAGLVPAVAPAPAAPARELVAEVSASQIPAGTSLVQLGAFESPEVARAEWERLARRFDSFMQGKTRVVQQAQSGGKTFWRLRAMGFEDRADAQRFCAVLLAQRAACIPVVAR